MLRRICLSLGYRLKLRTISVHDVFTPTVCADTNYVSRNKLETSLKNNYDIPGMQLVVYGHSGSGKTTLVRRFLSNKKVPHIITKCDTTTSFNDILYDAFDQLNPYCVSEYTKTHTVRWSSNLKREYKGLSAQLNLEAASSEGEKKTRLLPPQLTPSRLARMLGELKVVWVIEDFHKVSFKEKQHIADLLKLFVDNANDFPESKIICVGACNSAQELIEMDTNIRNRTAQIHVPMLSKDELTDIVTNGSNLLNIVMPTSLVDKIVYYSGRIGASAHNMCLDICLDKKIQTRQKLKVFLDDGSFNVAIKKFIDRNSDTLKTIYDAAVANELGWYVLKTFSCNSHEKLSIKEIEKRVNASGKGFSLLEIKEKLDELSSEQFKVLYYHKTSTTYSIATPFWKQFLRIQFALEQKEQRSSEYDRSNINLRLVNQNDQDASVEKLILELLEKLKTMTWPTK